jgi:Transglycosylase-like domain
MGVFLRTLALAVIVAVGAAGLTSPATAGTGITQGPSNLSKAQKLQVSELREGIEFHRSETWQWQDAAFRPRIKSNFMERKVTGLGYLKWMAKLWSKRRIDAKNYALNPPHKDQWQCIHRYERDPRQGWETRTGNGYYGGLQMDIDFQRAYGWNLLHKKGTANNWTWYEQMWVAERAYRSGRGFYPWPNTARYCGLI